MVRANSEPLLQLRLRQQALSTRVTRLQGVLVGLLIAAILTGSIAALRSSFPTAAQPRPALLKIQDRLSALAEPAAARSVFLQTSEQSDFRLRTATAEVEAFSVGNIRPTNGFITKSASSTQPDLAPTQARSSPSMVAAEPRVVPLPRRKPNRAALPRAKRPIAEEAQTTTDTQKPLEQEQSEQPKPMAFGAIGYNYDPQR
jgi:hypothetical protein